MFTREHLIWIGLCAVFVIVMNYVSLKKGISLKQAGYVMSLIGAVSETSKIMGDMTVSQKGGSVLDPLSLPFHLCSLMLFGVLYITFGREGAAKQTIIDFMAVMGTLGSVCAILIPTNGTDFTKIAAYQCFVYHAGLLWFSLYLIVSRRARLGLRTLGTNIRLLLILVWIMIYVNSILSEYNTNFMYLVRPPMKDLPFLTLEHGWYVYFLHLVSLGLIIIPLFHLPFIIAERKKKQ